MDKNKVLVRFENLADRFDTFNLNSSSVVQYVDVQKFAAELFNEANPEAQGVPKVSILETSLADGQSQASLAQRTEKFRWKGEDDEVMNAKPISHPPADKDPISGVALEPQRIRTFIIEYGKE